MNQAPIVFFIFNRPECTQKSFAVLRSLRPQNLFIIADGPRISHPQDESNCAMARDVVKVIDWPCNVFRDYSPTNLGLKRRISSGLDWVFDQVDRAIVIEDDCIPHPDFFRFCNNLLERYEFDERISFITGNNFQYGRVYGDASYYFSMHPHCWGWATWRRTWRLYDENLSFLSEWLGSTSWFETLPDPVERRYWKKIFENVQNGQINSWDYPLTACIWRSGGLTATPNVNLVSNIGFGDNATNTTIESVPYANLLVRELNEIIHPDFVCRDKLADRFVFDEHFGGRYKRFPRALLHVPFRVIRKIYSLTASIFPNK